MCIYLFRLNVAKIKCVCNHLPYKCIMFFSVCLPLARQNKNCNSNNIITPCFYSCAVDSVFTFRTIFYPCRYCLVWIGHYCTGTWITFFFGKNRCLQHNSRPACSIFAEKWISKLKEEVRNCYQQHGQYVILRETQTYMNENGSVLQGVDKIVFSNLLAFCIFCIPATLAYVAVLLAVLNCFWNN